MKNEVIYLTGAGFRVFTITATIATLAFTIFLICIHEQIPAYAIAAAVFVFAVCGFACFLCFNHRIIFSPEQSTIKYCALKSVVVSVAAIKRTEISTRGQTGLHCFNAQRRRAAYFFRVQFAERAKSRVKHAANNCAAARIDKRRQMKSLITF